MQPSKMPPGFRQRTHPRGLEELRPTRNLLDKGSAAQNLDGNRLKGSLLRPRYQATLTQPPSQEALAKPRTAALSSGVLTKLDGTHADFLRFVAVMGDIDQGKGQFRVQAQNLLSQSTSEGGIETRKRLVH